MHEIGLMEEALRIATAHAEKNGAARIHRLDFRIGPLAGVESEAFRFAFEVVVAGSMAEGATMSIEEIPILCWCAGCNQSFPTSENVFRCPRCNVLTSEVRQGREFDLVAVEIS